MTPRLPCQRLDALVRGTADPEPRTVALAALTRATRMDRALYASWAGRADRASLARIGQDQPAGPEVARAVAALELEVDGDLQGQRLQAQAMWSLGRAGW